MPDGTPQRRRRRRKCVGKDGEQAEPSSRSEDMDDTSDRGRMMLSRAPMPKRECPVPKPGGLVGEILGFKPSSTSEDGKGRPP